MQITQAHIPNCDKFTVIYFLLDEILFLAASLFSGGLSMFVTIGEFSGISNPGGEPCWELV